MKKLRRHEDLHGWRLETNSPNKWARIKALGRNTTLLAVYLDARDKFAKGSRDVVFPAGTWALRRYVNVQGSEASPAPAPE